MYSRRTGQAPRPRKSESIKFGAPVAGWIANRALADPQSLEGQGAAVLDNYVPRASSVTLRRGKLLYATLVEDSLPVTALFAYRNGADRKLFAANSSTIYDITAVPAPAPFEVVTEDEDLIVTEDGDWFGMVSTAGLEVLTSQTGGNWSVVQFATTGGVYLIGVNGQDEGFIYDGASFWPYVDGGIEFLAYDGLVTDFSAGETVTGGTSGATATIVSVNAIDASTGVLHLRDVSGVFEDNEVLTSAAGEAVADGVAAPAIPGPTFSGDLTSADMVFVWPYKNRLWFIEKDSLTAHYMEDVDAIGGSVAPFPFAGVLPMGGSLLFGQAWSLEAGAEGGLSEQCIFVSTEGEVVVFQGDDPTSASTWRKVGVYRIGKPLGRRAFFRGGGDLAIATSAGLVPLSKAISLDVTSLTPATVSYRIADAWQDAVGQRGLSDWQCALWPEQKIAIVSPPDMIGSTDPILFVSNTDTGAWSRFTNWHALCLEVFEGQLYFGSPEGRVYIGNATGLDDMAPFTGAVIPLFDDMGTPSSLKIGKMGRGVSRSTVPLRPLVTMKVDYNEVLSIVPDAVPAAATNLWGTGVWGASVWGEASSAWINQEWSSIGGAGYAISLAYQVTSGSLVPIDDELIRLEMTFSTSEIIT
jgi:hypothetical protein